MISQGWMVRIAVIVSTLHLHSTALCPDYDVTGCVRWSDNATWVSEMPGDGDSITINKCILLDVHSPRLQAVDITPQGQLIFSPFWEAEVSLTANNIRVAGLLRIGSARCRYEGNAQITLTGSPHDEADPNFGRKYIGVTAGGTLELHGAKKTPWSKVGMTLPKLIQDNGLYYDSKMANLVAWKPGFMLCVINPVNGGVVFNEILYTGGDSPWFFYKESKRLIDVLNWVHEGYVIAMAANFHPVTTHFNMTPVYEAIEKAFYCRTGNSRIRYLQPGQAWVGIAVKEHSHRSMERVGRHEDAYGFTTAFADLKMPLANFVIRVLCKRHELHWERETRILAATYDAGVPIVTMSYDVSSWQPGDRVVIASTDYDWKQAEEVTVEKCDIHHRNIICSPNQVRLSYDHLYEHWGKVTHRVDMRAEIGLLSRNVRVIGEVPLEIAGDDQKFGGQIKIQANFSNVHIQGVELFHMGQKNEQDAYPIFFDMCFNVSAEQYPNPAYVRENAIVDSFRSCVVLRGTHELLIEGNVAYRHAGSCYYLLEGGEKNNRIVSNLGLGTDKVDQGSPTLMPFERNYVATFFITNPLTYFRNNVAAGGEVRGIMYAFPLVPLRDSKNQHFMKPKEAKHTALAAFENNIAHSNGQVGLDMQFAIQPNMHIQWNSGYEPKQNPLDSHSPDKAVYIDRLTAYKNRDQNVNARGGLYMYHRNSISDSSSGFLLRTSSHQRQYIINSVILGESANQGEPKSYWYNNGSTWQLVPFSRSAPSVWNIHQPIQGVSLIDGPTFLYQVWFNNFAHTQQFYQVGAIGFLPNSRWGIAATTSCEKMAWGFDDGETTGNRVYDGDAQVKGFSDMTGDKQATFRDLDGSVTGVVNSTVVKPHPMIVTPDCTMRKNWNLAICRHRYGKIQVWSLGGADNQLTPLMSRDDVPTQPLDQDWMASAEFPVVLGGRYSYLLFFNDSMPLGVNLRAYDLEKDLWVRLGVCVPVGADLDLLSYSPGYKPNIQSWNEVMSTAELEATDISYSYFWDRTVGVIFFKFKSDLERNDTLPYDMDRCLGGRCTFVILRVVNPDSVDMTNGDCRDRAYGPYLRPATARETETVTLSTASQALPTTSLEPPEEYGAGAVYASSLVVAKDDGFGPWLEWSECTASCGGGHKFRQRHCEDANGCGGPSTERVECNISDCIP